MSIKTAVLTTLLAAAAAGCASDKVVRARLDVSVGQQLIDLKTAHDQGAMSRDEYDRQRARLIDLVR